MTNEETSRIKRTESGTSMRTKRMSETKRERSDSGRLLCDCFEEGFAFVLLVLFFD